MARTLTLNWFGKKERETFSSCMHNTFLYIESVVAYCILPSHLNVVYKCTVQCTVSHVQCPVPASTAVSLTHWAGIKCWRCFGQVQYVTTLSRPLSRIFPPFRYVTQLQTTPVHKGSDAHFGFFRIRIWPFLGFFRIQNWPFLGVFRIRKLLYGS